MALGEKNPASLVHTSPPAASRINQIGVQNAFIQGGLFDFSLNRFAPASFELE
jgi:hypothetical protein